MSAASCLASPKGLTRMRLWVVAAVRGRGAGEVPAGLLVGARVSCCLWQVLKTYWSDER